MFDDMTKIYITIVVLMLTMILYKGDYYLILLSY